MGCREVHKLLSVYLDDRVAPALRAELQAHLGQCPACAARLAELRRTVELLDDAFSGQAVDAESFASRTAEAARRESPAESRPLRPLESRERSRWLTIGWKVAAVLAVALAAALLLRPSHRRPPPVPPPASPQIELAVKESGVGRVELALGAVGVRAMPQARWSLARPGRPIEAGETLRTGSDPASCARLRLASGALVSINSATEARVVGDRSIELLTGDAHCSVPKMPGFTVAAPLCSIRVRGTEFDVTAAPGRVTVSVADGVVDVSARGEQRVVEPGRSLVVTETGMAEGSALDPPPWLVKLARGSEPDVLGRLVARVDGKEAPLSVKSHNVTVSIQDQIAYTLVEEEFENHTGARLEGTFYYPLPADASISRFAMYVDGKLMEGEMVERLRAREAYESFIRRKRDPALLEWMGGNEFKARVFPIEPSSTKRVLLGYAQVLPADRGIVTYTYPLKSDKLTKNPLRFLRVELDAVSTPPILDFASPTHQCEIQASEHHGHAAFQARDYVPTRDFVLRYRVTGPAAELYATPHWRDDEGGCFLALLSPLPLGGGEETPPRESGEEAGPADVLLMVDTSASMAGESFALAKRLAAAYLTFLGDEDRVNVLLYDLTPRLIFPAFVENSPENRQSAIAALEQAAPAGASDLAAALAAAAKAFKAPAAAQGGGTIGPIGPIGPIRPIRLIYLGDGIATIGSAEPAALLAAAKAAFAGRGVRVSTLAIGTRYDQTFIEGLARQFGGVSTVVSSSRPIAEIVGDLLNDSFRPMLADLKLSFEGVEVRDVYPRSLPNLLVGGQAIVAGRYGKPGKGKIILTGVCGGSAYRREIEVEFPGAKGPNTFVPHLWARRAMDDLLYRIGSGERKLVPQVIDLSLRYRLMSPYTSFLVLETEEDYKRFGIDRRFVMEQWAGLLPPRQQALASDGGYTSTGGATGHAPPSTLRFFDVTDLAGEAKPGPEVAAGEPAAPPSLTDRLAAAAKETETRGQDFFGVEPVPVEPWVSYGFGDEEERPRPPREESAAPASTDLRAGFTSALPPPADEGEEPPFLRPKSLFPYPEGPSEWGEPARKAPPVAPEIRKTIESFAHGPADFHAHWKLTNFDGKGAPASTEEGTLVVLGTKFLDKRPDLYGGFDYRVCDGETVHDCYGRQSYAAGRRFDPADLAGLRDELPGFVGCSPDRFLTREGVPLVESRQGDTLTLVLESGSLGRTRCVLDLASRVITKIEHYCSIHGDPRDELSLSHVDVLDQVKAIGGRPVPTRVRTYGPDGKLLSEKVFDVLQIGKVEGSFTFAPPESWLVLTEPLPAPAEARKAAEGAKRPDRAGFVLATALERTGKYAEAAAAVQKVAEARPADPYAALYLGFLRAAAGEKLALPAAADKAVALLKQRKLNPEQQADELHELYLVIRDMAHDVGPPESEASYSQRIVETPPQDALACTEWTAKLASEHVASGEVGKARALWQKLLQQFPDSGPAWMGFGEFLERRDAPPAEIEAALRKAHELGSSSKLLAFYREREDFEKAIPLWREALLKGPSDFSHDEDAKAFISLVADEIGPESAMQEAEALLDAAAGPGRPSAGAARRSRLAALSILGVVGSRGFAHDPAPLCRRIHEAYPRDPEVLSALFEAAGNPHNSYDPVPFVEKFLALEPRTPQEAIQQARLLETLSYQERLKERFPDLVRKLPQPKIEMPARQQAEWLSCIAGALEQCDRAKAIESCRRVLALGLPVQHYLVRGARSHAFEMLIESADHPAAGKLLSEALEADPTDDELPQQRERLVEGLRRAKQFDRIVPLLKEYRAARPEDAPEVGIELAAALSRLGKTRDACEELWAALLAAEAAVEHGDEKARNLRCFYEAGAILLRLSARDTQAQAKFDAAIAERAAREKPGPQPRWLALQLDVLQARGKLPALAAQLEALAARDPANPLWPRQLAAAFAATRQYAKAAAIYQKLTEQNPKDSAAWLALSRLAAAMGQPAKAEEYRRALLKAVPANDDFARALGEEFVGRGEIEKAIPILEKALESPFRTTDSAKRLADAYEKAGRKLDAALVRLRAFLADPPSGAERLTFADGVWLLLTDEAAFDRFAAEVERELAKAKEPPRHALLAILLTRLHGHRKDLAKAAAWAEKAVAEAPALDRAAFQEALASLRATATERVPAALRALADKAAAKTAPWLQLELARELANAKQVAQAEPLFRAAIAASPPKERTELAIELADLLAKTDLPRAFALLDELERTGPPRAKSRALCHKANLIVEHQKAPPEQAIAAYRAAAAIGPIAERRKALECLQRYASRTRNPELDIEATTTLHRLDRGEQDPDRRLLDLAHRLTVRGLAPRAEAVLRDWVRSLPARSTRRAIAWHRSGKALAVAGDVPRAVRLWAEGAAEVLGHPDPERWHDYLLTSIFQGAGPDEPTRDLVRKTLLDEMDRRLKPDYGGDERWPEKYWEAARGLKLVDALRAKIQAVPANRPEFGDIYHAIASLYAAYGCPLRDDGTALKYYTMALQSPSLRHRAWALAKAAGYHQEHKQWPEALALLDELVKLEPDAHNHRDRGYALAKLGKADEALRAFEEAAKLTSADDAFDREWIAQRALEAGLHDFAIRETRLALRIRIREAKDDPAQADDSRLASCYAQLAKALLAKGEREKAVDELLTGLTRVRTKEHREELARDLAAIYQESGKLGQLVADYEKQAAATGTEKPLLRLIFGDAYRQKGEADAALKHYRAALDVAPALAEARQHLLEILKERGQTDELMDAYRQWARHDPKNLEPYKELGRLLDEAGKPDESLRAYSSMLDALPTEAESHREMAGVFANLGRHADAVAMWKKVVQFRPEEPEGYYGLAEAHAANGEREPAAQVYRGMLRRTWDERFGDVPAEARRRLADLEAGMEKKEEKQR